MPGYAFRAIDTGETRAYVDAVNEAFQHDPEKEEVALLGARLEHDRTRVAVDEGAIVGTSGLFSLRLAVPGASSRWPASPRWASTRRIAAAASWTG